MWAVRPNGWWGGGAYARTARNTPYILECVLVKIFLCEGGPKPYALPVDAHALHLPLYALD